MAHAYAAKMAETEAKLKGVLVIDWARLAAFIDGEGYVGIRNNGRGYVGVAVSITNTDPRLPLWLKETFGGTVVTQPTRQGIHKPAYQWSVSSRHAGLILSWVRPLLIIKGEQADLCLSLRKLVSFGRNAPLTQQEREERLSLQGAVVKLNRRGVRDDQREGQTTPDR